MTTVINLHSNTTDRGFYVRVCAENEEVLDTLMNYMPEVILTTKPSEMAATMALKLYSPQMRNILCAKGITTSSKKDINNKDT